MRTKFKTVGSAARTKFKILPSNIGNNVKSPFKTVGSAVRTKIEILPLARDNVVKPLK